MATGLESSRHLGLTVMKTLLIIVAAGWLSPVSTGFIRFKPDTEYLYTFRSSTDLKNVRTLQADSKIGFVLVKGLADSLADHHQHVYFRVHSAGITSDEEHVLLSGEKDFSKWFSFDIDANGTISHVYYPRDEDDHVLEVKKGLTNLLAGNLQYPEENQAGGSRWEYDSTETGHEGYHEASYTARMNPGRDGIIVFTKTRRTHPIPYGKTKHQKEIHYHPGLQVPTMIKILDQFDAPRDTADGFVHGFPENEADNIEFPEMQSFSEGQLTFLHEAYYPSPTGLPKSEDIVTGSIQMKVPGRKHDMNVAVLKEFIIGNLTCMRTTTSQTGSRDHSQCFQDLVEALHSVHDGQQLAVIVVPYYKPPLSRRIRDKQDRLNMLDAVASLHNDVSQSLLTDLILLSPMPNKELVERLLIASAGFIHTISEHFVDTVEDIVFHPQLYPAPLNDREIQRVAVLVLGALAGHLWDNGHQHKAEQIVAKIEDKLGVHDPWAYDKTLASLTDDEKDEHHHDTVAWIEALGNAGLHRSFPHIQSYTNATNTPPLLKRAGLHSLRDYHHDEAAGILLQSALDENEDDNVRYEASLIYKDHPYGGFQNVSKFISAEESNSSHKKISTEAVSVPSRHRVRRGFWEGIQFRLSSPSIYWKKSTGSALTGAEFGLTIRNELDMSIAPLKGHLRVDLFDEAYATVLVGLIRTTFDVFRARFCFSGFAEYNLNILQEYGVERISNLVKIYDRIIGEVVGNIRSAVNVVVGLFRGETSIAQLFHNFVETLESIPERIKDMRSVAMNAVVGLAQFDSDQLPPSIKGAITAVQKAAQLFSDIKTDIMDFDQAVNEAISVALPWAAEQVEESVLAIADSVVDLLSSPLKAVGDMFKGVLNIKISTDVLLDARKKIEDSFSKQGQQPYWSDLAKRINSTIYDLLEHLGNVRRDLSTWVEEGQALFDPVQKQTGGATNSGELRRKVQEKIESIFQDLIGPIKPIFDLFDPFLKKYNLVVNSIKQVKEAYQTLKNGYQNSQTLVMKYFGPKAHKRFPRKYREPGSGACASGGFYPTDSAGFYQDQGVDLEIPSGSRLVAPFSGVLYGSSKPNQVILKAGGGAFTDTKIIIDNIDPTSDTISETRGEYVIAGTVIGIVGRSTTCTPPNYIHFSMKTSKPDRLAAILNNDFDDEGPSAADVAAEEGFVDPGYYLEKRALEIPKWMRICDDYKLVWKGKTVTAGSLLGRRYRNGERLNTSPRRAPVPDTRTDRPDPSKKPPPFPSPLGQAVSSQENKAETKEALGFPEIKIGSGSPFKNFTLRNLKIGSILTFARKVGLDDTADALLNVIRTIVKFVSDKPCVLPESLTNDALRIELQQRGLSSQGDRQTLLQRYRQPDDRCPLLQVSLPKNVYCKIDKSCLGVECCMNVKLFMISFAFKAFMRFDPCELQFVIGVNSWNRTINILDAEFGKESDVAVPFDIPFVDDMELHLRYSIEKTETQLLVSMSVGLCPVTGDADCLPFKDVLRESVILLPFCHSSESSRTFTWPDIDITEHFDRSAPKKLLKETGEEVLEAGAEAALSYVLYDLGIPKEFLSDKELCLTPRSMSNFQLTTALQDRHLLVTGTRMEQENRLSEAQRSCNLLTLPAFASDVAEIAYCSLSQNCLSLDCCLDLNIQKFGFRRSFKVFVEVNACDFTFTVAFQHLQYKRLLLSYNWGEPQQQTIGAITLTYSIDKLMATKEFQIDFGASICPSGGDCIFDIDIIRGYKVPIPICNSDFSLSLPGGDSLAEFVNQVGQNAEQQAVDILLEYIGLKDKINDVPCDSATLITEDACNDVTLPPLPSTVGCSLTDRCLGVRCCAELDLKITTISSNVWLILDPCNFTLSIGLGKWSSNFTIFDYHWGAPKEIKIGKALTLIYSINKLLTEDQVFELDFGFAICFPETECDTPSVDILRGFRVPIPLCNDNVTFTLPGDGTVGGFLETVGENAAGAAVEAILQFLGLSDFISQTAPCDRPQVTQNGWQRICPRDVRLPHLPRNLICTLPEKCLGFDCCLELPIPGIPAISTRFFFVFDPCNFQLALSLGSWSQDLNVLSYQWGQRLEVSIGEPFTISMTIDKVENANSFRMNVDATFCLDGDCILTPVLGNTLVPIPVCNLSTPFELPGDGSFAGLAGELAGSVGELAVVAALRKLGIQQYVIDQQCEMELLAPTENKCPRLSVPTPSSLLTCTLDDRCLGLHCCASLDLIITRLSTTAWAILDPCEFQLSVGLGTWYKNVTLLEADWGMDQTLDIGDAVHITFNIDRLTEENEFLVDLSIVICIDDTCQPIHLLQGSHMPIPTCNPNATLTLPGDGTIAGYLRELGGQVTEAAIDLVLNYVRLKDFLSRRSCMLPATSSYGGDSCPVQLPNMSLPQLSCQFNDPCTSLHCCLTFDLLVTQVSSKAWFEIDPCDYTLSVGLELWYFNVSLFSYEWGKTEEFAIGRAVSVKFSIDKLDSSAEYEVDLTFSLDVDGIMTGFPVMERTRIPIPVCGANSSALALPGDGTVRGFLQELGDNVGQAAIQPVLKQLNIEEIISGTACELSAETSANSNCPLVSLPFLKDVLQCTIDDRCHGIQCCIHLDFVITSLMLSSRIQVDPCEFWIYVAFDNWEYNATLFSYSWGTEESVSIGDALTIRYSIDKLSAEKVFSITLNVELCIDDTCTTTPVLDHVWILMPLCNTNATLFSLPGDGTVEGFIQELGGRIGDSAVDLVLEKLGLNEYLQSTPCDRGTPGSLRSGCPAVDVSNLPDFLSCTVMDTCLGIRCCLEMDLKITARSVNAWVILDPCNFNLSIGFEKWERSVMLFHYPMGDVMEEVVNSVLTVRWRIAKITADKQFEVDLSLVLCVDGVCETVTVLSGSRLPIPLCNTQDAYTLPGNGTVAGFLDYLGGNIGQFAVDAALRHLELNAFLTGRGCSYPRQDICGGSAGLQGNCSLIGATCTELRCCLDLDLMIADLSATAWFKYDPCDFTFTLGVERWLFHGTPFSYNWGEEKNVSIASGMNLRYSVTMSNGSREFEVMLSLQYCIDELCSDIDIQQTIPILLCDPDFSNYTLSAEGFVQTASGQVVQGASLALLSRLGIDPDFFNDELCVSPSWAQSYGNCPSMRLPDDLSPLAHCHILSTCYGVRCCLDVNLGPLNHTFSTSMVIDPCIGQLTLQFGKWQHSKSLSHMDLDTVQELTIGNFILLSYLLELADDKVSVSLSVDACIDGHCTGSITLLDGAVSPLPMCYPNGTISWNSLPGVTFVSHLGSLDAGFEEVAQGLGLPSRLVSATPCPPVLQPSQSVEVCPHLSHAPTIPSGGVCRYTDTCIGVQCCLVVDLGTISRTVSTWLTIDPCDFKLSVGFENWSYNVTLLSYKWGKVTRERLSDVISLSFVVDKTSDNRNCILSLSLQFCIGGPCSPDVVIMQDFSAPIPYCSPNGTIDWARDLAGDVADYASSLVVNRLGVSLDVLSPTTCSEPPDQITPSTSGCSALSLPTSASQYCSLDESCLGVGCCLTLDLDLIQRSFSFWVKLDPCALTFSFGFENWNYQEMLSVQVSQSHSQEVNIGFLKIRYNVERPHDTVYDIDLDLILCWQDVCKDPIVILQDAMFMGTPCGGSGVRRKRRSVDDLASEFEEDPDTVVEQSTSSVDVAVQYFRKLLNTTGPVVMSAEDNIMTKLQPEKVVKPRVAGSGTESRRSMGILVFDDEDEAPSRERRDVSITGTSGGESLFDLSFGLGSDSDTWQGSFVIGGGMTPKGLDALGRRISNMTIGELEAMLDLQNLDPFTIVQLMKDLRAVYRTFIEEFIDVTTNGIAEDNFKQFDLVLRGTIQFPTVHARFFVARWGTFVGFLYLEFTMEAGGFFSMKIPVSVGLVSMKAKAGITPMVGAYVRGGVSIGAVLYGELELTAYVLHTSFPTVAESVFRKFPLDIGLRLDVEMIPLIIRLRGLVTLKIPFRGRKVLFQRDLWRFQSSAIHGNIFHFGRTEPDTSPPEIVDYSTPVDVVGVPAASSSKCGVEQVPGLDYTEPAFQLEIVAADDKSLVTFLYQVGTVPGGHDVVSKTEFGGPSAIISQILLGGHPLHFTVYAMNTGGGTSFATCSLATFDITLPTGRITPDFISTSRPDVLRASAVVYDDSVILMQKEAVGFGVDIWGDQIVPWNVIDINERQHLESSTNTFDYFTAGKTGKLISTPTSAFQQINPNFCARDCLALPETKCLSINFNYEDYTCELLEEIEGHGVEVHEYGLFVHFERLGVGHAVKFSHDAVRLDHNNLYYFNIELLNFVAYENIVSSVGILADFTPPAPGLIVSETRDEVVHEACVDFTPDEWERRCIEDTYLDNHRYITDGPGSMTVFNGYEELVDAIYTRSNTFMAANWDGFHDNETGIYGYTWSIGNAVCDDDVSMHIDPHSHLFDESEWTHQGLVVNVNLPDGAYFITVRALNKAEFGGPMVLTVCHSNPLIIDTTPPIIHGIDDITYDSIVGRIGLRVYAEDPECDLFEYHLAAGKTPRDISLHDWQAHGLTEHLFMDFKIPNGVPCWMKVRAVNNVDLRSIRSADEPILVDGTPPIAGDLYDGPYPGQDLVFTKDKNQICANWRNWYDPESGIFSYLWSVGTRPGLSNVVDSVSVSRQEHVACSGYVTLQHGETYYSTLVAFHGGYDKLNVSASSDGVTLDLTPPVEGTIVDGLLPGPTDLEFSSRPATVEAQWQGFSDPDSGIRDYQVTVYRKHDISENSTNVHEVIHEAQSVESDASSIEWHHFHLHHRDQVYVNLRTVNQALDHIDTATNGFLVDLTPPMLRALGDGLVVGYDADYQSNSDSLSVHWNYFDDESGIESFELAIFEMREGRKRRIYPQGGSFLPIADVEAKSHVQTGLSLRTGYLYITRIKARNHAKLLAFHETSGIKVDPTPPVMVYVRGGNVDGELEELTDGFVYQNSRTTIQASWSAVDGQSGIKNYWVAIGTAPSSEDIRPFTSLGSKGSRVLSNLNLELTNQSTCDDTSFTVHCQPVYYVCVKSENGAGAFSDITCSSPIRVVEEDQTGFVTDGADMMRDINTQKERTTVTIWFDDFQSELHGIGRYEWSVGTSPGGEDVQPLTSEGIVPGNDADVQGLAGQGKAQSPLHLEHGVTYYSTLRAVTNGDNILESTSNGFTVDITPPDVAITQFGQYDTSLDLSLEGGVNLYQINTDSVDAAWEIKETEGDVTAARFSMGQYPGGNDVFPWTQTNKSYVPASLMRPTGIGQPNILAVQAINNVGLKRTVYSTSLTVDTTPPIAGKVRCPDFIHAASAVLCHWSDFLDVESGIHRFRFLVGSAEGRSDVFQSSDLPEYLTYYSVKDLNLIHNKVYYVTIEAFNAVNQSILAFSDPIQIDDTPPSHGIVVELSGVYTLNSTDPEPQAGTVCSDQDQCSRLDGECLESIHQVQILWEAFSDEDSQITKYEVALGTTPGGSQIKSFYEVSRYQTSEFITDIDLGTVRKVYASVRGYNQAGLTTTAVSNGIYVSRFSAGLELLGPFVVKDGVTDSDLDDLDFQISLNQISALWDFSGDPCPIRKYKLAIYRIDGLEIQELTDVGERTSDTNTNVELTDGETYYTIVQATNALGLTTTIRSDGITIQREPLIPGRVYDGLLVGFDLAYQKNADSISASWSGFGHQGRPAKEAVQHTGNAEVTKDRVTEQTVDYYEAAVGTDRRYPNTRDNVVPFTYVGRNTSVTFAKLDLESLDATYYVTVRAYSASFSTAEVTSTGINVGVDSTVHATEVEIPEYVNSPSEIDLRWRKFESSFPILMYYVGLGKPSSDTVSPQDMNCLDMVLGTEQALAAYSQRQIHFVGKDTYAEVTGLNLTQNGSYYVTVVGMNEAGQCNASTSYFTVDVTPPNEGRLRSGLFYDMPVAYTDSAKSISAAWKDYKDEESGIKSFQLRLMEAASCDVSHGDDLTPVPGQDWLVLGPDIQDFTFVELSLVANHPYYVQLEAVNNALSGTMTQVGPIFLDDSKPTAGLVVDGVDFKTDVTNSGDRHQVSGTILHLPDPDGPVCPLRVVPFTDTSQWSALDFKGLWTMDRDNWDLLYQPAQVLVSDESITLKLERDVSESRMLSGAYITNAQIVRSSEYEFDLIAASGELHSVTSLLLWDGPDGAIGEFDFAGRKNWREGICQCCYAQPFNQSACQQCDCEDFLGAPNNSTDDSSATTLNTTDQPPVTTATTTTASKEVVVTEGESTTVTTRAPWSVEREDEDDDQSTSDGPSGRQVIQRACGVQFHPSTDGGASQVVLWCRFYENEWPMAFEVVDLTFDPSSEEHHYSVHVKVTPFDAQQDEWSLELYVDGKLLSSLIGIPVLSASTQLAFHVFNRDNFLADLHDPFNPPSATATLRNLRLPADQSRLCRYGAPFRAGTSPVSRYFAGIGTEAGTTDILEFQEVARPCVPCINPCDRYQCDTECSTDAVPITFTLRNLTLPRLEPPTVSPNDTNTTMASVTEDVAVPFFLTVQCFLGNGKWEMSSSNGFYVDDTPPVLDLFFYIDVNGNEFEPTSYQSSNSTISALWTFIDLESKVKEHFWAIGTSKGATDLQDFISVGLNGTATNSNLLGQLHHNNSYFVTLRVINGAGLETLTEFDGVTVLIKEPSIDGVNTTSKFSQEFQEEVYPPNVEKSEDPTKTGISWSKAKDKSVTHYEYCVSSSIDLLDDVVQCMVVGVNSSGSVSIECGQIIVTAGSQEERYNISDFLAPQEADPNDVVVDEKAARFNMEPGKSLYSWMKMCNSAMLCVTEPAGTTTVIGDDDMMVTSIDGADVTLTLTPSQTTRRRRAAESHFDLTVATQGGLHQGGSLVLGLLDADRVNEEYTSDATPKYAPYITNPLYTIQYTSRLLKDRIRFVYEPQFYITSLGQTELQGPMSISISLNTPGNWTEAKPRLIYWNSNTREWEDAAMTCSGVNGITYKDDGNQLTVQVCSTRTPAGLHSPAGVSRKRRSADQVDPITMNGTMFFRHETEFALAIITDAIPNSPPQITNLIQDMFMYEDEGTLRYTFTATDPENDVIVFELVPDDNVPGIATITEDGQFSYTPCSDCHGLVSLQVNVREVQTLSEIQALSTSFHISIDVRPVNDDPVLYVAHNGKVVGNGRVALLTVEQNTGLNVAYKHLTAAIGAYDVDRPDNLTITHTSPVHGTLTFMTLESKSVPPQWECSEPSVDSNGTGIPCDLVLPRDKDAMTWAMTTLTYSPDSNYHGRDSFEVLVEDQFGAMSQLLEIQIAVLVNPCVNNGTCGGPVEDPNCTSPARSSGFESYYCICDPGWVGDTCQTDHDECQSTPCEYPYVCYDNFNGFECACPSSDPTCDVLDLRVKVVIGLLCAMVVILIIAINVFCFIFRKKHRKLCIYPETDTNADDQSIANEVGQTVYAVQTCDNATFDGDTGGDVDMDRMNVPSCSSSGRPNWALSSSSMGSIGTSVGDSKLLMRPCSPHCGSSAVAVAFPTQESEPSSSSDGHPHEASTRESSEDMPERSASPISVEKWAESVMPSHSSDSLKNAQEPAQQHQEASDEPSDDPSPSAPVTSESPSPWSVPSDELSPTTTPVISRSSSPWTVPPAQSSRSVEDDVESCELESWTFQRKSPVFQEETEEQSAGSIDGSHQLLDDVEESDL